MAYNGTYVWYKAFNLKSRPVKLLLFSCGMSKVDCGSFCKCHRCPWKNQSHCYDYKCCGKMLKLAFFRVRCLDFVSRYLVRNIFTPNGHMSIGLRLWGPPHVFFWFFFERQHCFKFILRTRTWHMYLFVTSKNEFSNSRI